MSYYKDELKDNYVINKDNIDTYVNIVIDKLSSLEMLVDELKSVSYSDFDVYITEMENMRKDIDSLSKKLELIESMTIDTSDIVELKSCAPILKKIEDSQREIQNRIPSGFKHLV